MTVETVSQSEMLAQFKERFSKLIAENQQLANKIKENETTALKLQGAIETLEYYNPEEEEETMSLPPEEDSEDLQVGLTE
ncbi:hypothetical protein Syn7803C99_83 [Synechococcus phage ACG-2014a]|jgi:hypothetical protein|uniref:Uncharacterized protein n=1 Tax=Synechococcus phage ACG-2014a TaxID=1493507 RepID=A0A0E3FK67_9CAUD|nr:hypothetical protein Syn7803C99_83 [Synechococcus phage ACG-2014a]AIX28219.1 hypothetical protein Syn7803US1_83 [Synechococcus phage ACG-2014a]AIX35424.1 hypothetical protein Syn7803US62_83 [Synechococcus phage ACG-2014a]AIX36720.1 hypothetical protein Syn7803US79_84 [Synechococcus phage ACG-2014a]AIX39603.1 hypothetical protein Syn7803C101_85 [Synechococcus phage ACG-2014a]